MLRSFWQSRLDSEQGTSAKAVRTVTGFASSGVGQLVEHSGLEGDPQAKQQWAPGTQVPVLFCAVMF